MLITTMNQPGTITIDIKTALLCLLILGGVVLIVFLIVAAYRLIKTLEQTKKVLDDFEVVGKIASDRTQQIDKLISQVERKAKSGQGFLNALPAIIRAVSQIAKTAAKKSEADTTDSKKK